MRFLRSVIRCPSVCHGSLGSLTAGGTKVTAGELALQRLANVPRGIAKTLMLAHGFTPELIAGLVLCRLCNGGDRHRENRRTDDRGRACHDQSRRPEGDG